MGLVRPILEPPVRFGHARITRVSFIITVFLLRAAVASHADDWPTARGDGGRTGATASGPTGPLARAWQISTPAPAPAWANEARGSLWQHIDHSFTARAADDIAPLPVISGDAVVFGTTHDEVRCVDLTSGKTRWTYFCAGPVRYAPAIDGGQVFVGSDDGFVRALSLADGTEVWSVRIGPALPLVAGNNRLISPCPVRTGLLVSRGALYVAAGLFPLEGVYLDALAPQDGHVLWRRRLEKSSPQGYIVDAGAEIIVPFGRASPRAYRKSDGAPAREIPSSTGTYAVVEGDETLAGPGATGVIEGASLRSGAKLISYPGRMMCVTPARSFLGSGTELLALDRETIRTAKGDLVKARLWNSGFTDGSALMVAGDRIYAGGSNRIEVLDAATGRSLQTLEAIGQIVALAAGSKGVVAVNHRGVIQAFVPGIEKPVSNAGPNASAPSAGPSPGLPWLDTAVRQLVSRRGLALWTGTNDPLPAIHQLVASTDLQIVAAVPTADAVRLRQTLAAEGSLGVRTTVMVREPGPGSGIASHLFNLVIADGLPPDEATRLACPGRSGIIVQAGTAKSAPDDPMAGTWTHQYGTGGNLCASRQSMSGFPRLHWFGGHGPELMPDRHTRGPAPLAAGGILISMAEDALIATDARNGTVRWSLELPDSMHYAMPYDAGYAAMREDGSQMFIAVGTNLCVIDTASGRMESRVPCPADRESWGWVAVEDRMTYGSSMLPNAARTKKEYDLVDADYRSGRPMVCSKSLFAFPSTKTKALWVHQTGGAFVNPGLCAAAGRVYAIESRGAAARSDRSGRLTCASILQEAYVLCWDGATGKPEWEMPLRWPQAQDVLGLAATGDRLILSCAESVGGQAAYHLRCWNARDGRELWSADGLNPIHDLYHGQQVKRPVVLPGRVSFESALFELDTGSRWSPPGAGPGWILSRPGHACGGMTGAADGLLFRADNPTFFRFADGTFTRLAPTRPGCWLNILPAQGGILIPEASASCICGYPIQTSLGFAFDSQPAPLLPDIQPPAAR